MKYMWIVMYKTLRLFLKVDGQLYIKKKKDQIDKIYKR